MTSEDERAERTALARQVATPVAPHETDGFVDLRERCRCNCNVGRVRLKSGQLTVRCADCDRFAFDAPRELLGLPPVAVEAVRIASRWDGTCKACGAEHEQGNWVWWVPQTKGVLCGTCAQKP